MYGDGVLAGWKLCERCTAFRRLDDMDGDTCMRCKGNLFPTVNSFGDIFVSPCHYEGAAVLPEVVEVPLWAER